MDPVVVALKGKGLHLLAQRTVGIMRSYGYSPQKMEKALQRFANILCLFGHGATFPVVASVLVRNSQVIQRYQDQGIEFAIHGHRHIDYQALSQEEQLEELSKAHRVFGELGVSAEGFRAPYLHASADTLMALRRLGFAYDSSSSISWEILPGSETPAYRHALAFYGAVSAREHPSLPLLEGGLVRIPYSLPDDEALVHRLATETPEQMQTAWLSVLHRSHELGEMLALGLHPERISQCEGPLVAVLTQACRLVPAIWIARLDEIAKWWHARTKAVVSIVDVAPGKYEVSVAGPRGTTIFTRGLDVEAPTTSWSDGYEMVDGPTVTVRSSQRPFIGLSPRIDLELASFVQQQGYVVEMSERFWDYECYLDQTHFAAEDQRALLTMLESATRAIVRLGRWPYGTRSALAITGDIDALTIWDYGFRFLGR